MGVISIVNADGGPFQEPGIVHGLDRIADNYQEKKIVDACLYRPDLFKPEDRIINDGKLSYINKFIPNKPLMTLFGLKGKKPKLTFVEINKYISPHFTE